ncbi:MAG: threonine/serine dehydratase [Anaerolineae bacterium]|nr:threonine/serine dehydratase [Gemmatimonadaceae bacterium]
MPHPTFDELRAIDVFAAAKRINGIAERTPLERSVALSEIAGGDVWLKCEHRQKTGSFKLRGAFNAISSLPREVRERGVIASSAGNHGLGVAFAAKHFAIPATIFVPRAAPEVKRHGIESLGATVDSTSSNYDSAMVRAKEVAAERKVTFINPCSGRDMIAGQGTVALEIIEEVPEIAMLIVPVGGGGLLAGIASLLRRVASHVRIAGAQSVNTAAMARSLEASHVVPIESVQTLADGLAGDIDEFALEAGQRSLDELVTLTEREIGDAIVWLANEGVGTVEGSGAVGVAALLTRKFREIRTPAVIVVSGGNIDRARHEGLMRQGL